MEVIDDVLPRVELGNFEVLRECWEVDVVLGKVEALRSDVEEEAVTHVGCSDLFRLPVLDLSAFT